MITLSLFLIPSLSVVVVTHVIIGIFDGGEGRGDRQTLRDVA